MARVKLAKVARDMNLSLVQVHDFFQQQGIPVTCEPNARIDEALVGMYEDELKNWREKNNPESAVNRKLIWNFNGIECVSLNPFRVLGAYADDPQEKIDANITELLPMVRKGVSFPFPTDMTQQLGPLTRTREMVENAISILSDPYERELASLFWFYGHAAPISPQAVVNQAILSLMEPDPEDALKAYQKALRILTVSKPTLKRLTETLIDFLTESGIADADIKVLSAIGDNAAAEELRRKKEEEERRRRQRELEKRQEELRLQREADERRRREARQREEEESRRREARQREEEERRRQEALRRQREEEERRRREARQREEEERRCQELELKKKEEDAIKEYYADIWNRLAEGVLREEQARNRRLEDSIKEAEYAYKKQWYTTALRHYKIAAQIEEVFMTREQKRQIRHAQYQLGKMYYHGQGVSRNVENALDWYNEAAEGGYPKAQRRLGFMYLFGMNVGWNPLKAFKLIFRSLRSLGSQMRSQNSRIIDHLRREAESAKRFFIR